MADPKQDGILSASGPFGMEPAETQIGSFLQGTLNIPSWLYDVNKDIGDAMLAAPGQLIDYLGSPTEYGQAKIDEEKAAMDAANAMTEVESGDPLAAIKGEFGPLGEFGGMETGVDTDVDEIANTLEALNITPSELKGGRGTIVEKPGDRVAALSETAVTQAQADEGFLAAMDDFLESARGAGPEAPKERTIEEYKRVFSEATGIDTSGKVDKKDALMAFGLALMQNKAGKGFNVGKMLKSVGEAGDKALPALQRAKTLAREGALAGGKYALQTQASDKASRAAAREKAMEREQYYVYERGPDGAPFATLDKGDLYHLSKYELNQLMNDPKFDKNYSFIKGKDYMDITTAGKDTDLGDPYGKETNVSLLGGDTEGVNPIYIVDAQRPDGNYKGRKKEKSFLQSDARSIATNMINEQQSILQEQDEFKGLIGNIQSGVSIPKQIGSSIVQFGRNLGLDLGTGPTQIAQARKKLEKIQLLNATEILQESGKTLSDADRERVSKFVGQINLATADDVLILQSIGRVYDIVLQARQRDLDTAVSNLDNMFGIKFEVGRDAPPTQEELDAMNKEFGTSFTMENYTGTTGS
jgi:hypothetical protein